MGSEVRVSTCAVCAASLQDAAVIFASNRSFKGTHYRSSLTECRQCGHVMLNPRPTPEGLAAYYGDDYHCYADDGIGEAALADTEAVGEDCFNHVPITRGARYLDIGCGVGSMVAAMSHRGMLAEGVEPSEAAARRAAKLGRRVVCGTLEDVHFPDAHFDCMSMYHVLEHVADIKALLAECRRILKVGGHFVIGVPNFDSLVFERVGKFWVGLQLPTHLHHFRMEPLSRLVLDAGFSVDVAFSESLVPHVEGELVNHIRRKYKIPARLLLRSGAIKPYARKLAAEGERTGRGEALVLRLRKTRG